ncbi:PqqD family protein of HPr-rel-A system [Sphingopyxis panaciterrae]|uniref:HPr-rel-A system PqqD family peptide chaperone n=1 Tax=Sphingopyxis panaciterrae TaxID=363841 RepID=UPI00141F37DA|nr:HPr-rel-A system PqqD family peptide chaperone [Sphingopyxis panaciterrae]NIJ37331.1 PqqD family protein of HPr-rel-A system [Sphingopyxis panaciterrae]
MPDAVYRAAPPDALRIEPLGDLTAIFDRRSTQTHLVVPPIPEILTLMGDAPCDAAALAARLAAAFDLDAEGDARVVVAERLAELAAIGLVERA